MAIKAKGSANYGPPCSCRSIMIAATVYTNREHWIQRITFAAETNAACSRYVI